MNPETLVPWSGLVAVLALGAWLWVRGVDIANRYLSAAGEQPLGKGQVTFWFALAGGMVLYTSPWEPALAGGVGLAMIGSLSALVDARTHKLPNALTAALALCAVPACALAIGAGGSGVAWGVLIGVLVWTVPLTLAALPKAGLGLGDVKLAPVLGAILGAVGVQPAIAGFVMGLLAAGVAAVVRLARTRDAHQRMAFGPYLTGGALAAWILYVTLPAYVPALMPALAPVGA